MDKLTNCLNGNSFLKFYCLLMFICISGALPVKADMLMEGEEQEYPIYYRVKGIEKFIKEFDFYYSDKPHGKGSKTHTLIEGKLIPLTRTNGLESIYIWAVSKRTNLKTQCYSGYYNYRDVTLNLEAIKYNVLIFNWGDEKSHLNKIEPSLILPGNNRNSGLMLASLAAFIGLVVFYFKTNK